MQRILRWLIGLPVALFVIVFAVANRQRVTLSFNPFVAGESYPSISMPLWLLFFFGIITGVILGWIGCWFAQAKHRKRAREAAAEVVKLQAERANLMAKAEPEPHQNPQQDIVPVGTGWI